MYAAKCDPSAKQCADPHDLRKQSANFIWATYNIFQVSYACIFKMGSIFHDVRGVCNVISAAVLVIGDAAASLS